METALVILLVVYSIVVILHNSTDFNKNSQEVNDSAWDNDSWETQRG